MADCSNTISKHDEAVLKRILNPELPFADINEESVVLIDPSEPQDAGILAEIKRLETEGMQAAEGNDLDQALQLFNQAIDVVPTRASGYNNRGQVLRLQGDTAGALESLNKAIELSSGEGNAACQAYIQRGLIRRLEGQDEAAIEDFKCAAKLGSDFAKKQLVALNPYAALCNQMLGEVMQKLRKADRSAESINA